MASPYLAIALANINKFNNGDLGISVPVTTAGAIREDVGHRHKQSDAVTSYRMRILEQKTERGEQTITLSVSGNIGYKPAKDDGLLVDDVKYRVRDIDIKKVGADIYEYQITGVA